MLPHPLISYFYFTPILYLHAQPTYNENDLLLRIAEDDEKAFSRLFAETSGLVFSYIFRLSRSRDLAEEVVQDIFIQIWKTRKKLGEIKNFRVYLYVISRNRMLNEIKRMVRERRLHKEWTLTLTSSLNEESTNADEQDGHVVAAIVRLPPRQKMAWILSRRERMSYNEIAVEMDISRETVKTYLQHADNSITNYLSQYVRR